MQPLGRLERIELREVWANEAGDFTPWLALEENIALLSDVIGLDLEVEAQEKEVGPFRADILCRDTANDTWVLIENQLERTDHTHLGQLLTYASGLNAVTVVWIAGRFTDEHRAVLDWLNEVTDTSINAFGLEIELWRIGGSHVAPKFNIVSKPNDWTRIVSRRSTVDTGLTETKQAQLEYWTRFHEVLAEQNAKVRGTRPAGQHWNNFSVGRSDFRLTTFVDTRDKRIGLQLTCKGEQAKPHFYLLREQRLEIEAKLGELEWDEMPERKSSNIVLQQRGVDPLARVNWSEQHAWLAERLEAFHAVFRPVAKALDAEEWDVEGNSGDLATEVEQAA